MLQLPDVQEYIERGQEEIAKRCQVSQDEWLKEWKKIGFSNITNYVEDDFSPKKLSEAKDTEVIKSVKRTVTTTETGDTKVTTELALHDKPNALINIGKHLGWYEKDNGQLVPKIPERMTVEIVPPIQE